MLELTIITQQNFVSLSEPQKCNSLVWDIGIGWVEYRDMA